MLDRPAILLLVCTGALAPLFPGAAGAPLHANEAAEQAELESFLKDWSRTSDEVKTLEVRFRQEKFLKLLRKPLVSEGTVRLAEGRLKCVVRDHSGKLDSVLLVEKEDLRIFYPRHKRLEIYDLATSQAPAMAFPIFGSDPERLKRDYNITLTRVREKRKLTLTPKDKESLVGPMTLEFSKTEIQAVEQLDGAGNRVRMTIESFERNPKLDARDLALELPTGIRTVRPLAGKKRPESGREGKSDE